MHLEVPNRSGMLASIAQGIASVGGNISSLDITEQTRSTSELILPSMLLVPSMAIRSYRCVKTIPEVRLTGTYDRTMQLHRGGKIRMEARFPWLANPF